MDILDILSNKAVRIKDNYYKNRWIHKIMYIGSMRMFFVDHKNLKWRFILFSSAFIKMHYYNLLLLVFVLHLVSDLMMSKYTYQKYDKINVKNYENITNHATNCFCAKYIRLSPSPIVFLRFFYGHGMDFVLAVYRWW